MQNSAGTIMFSCSIRASPVDASTYLATYRSADTAARARSSCAMAVGHGCSSRSFVDRMLVIMEGPCHRYDVQHAVCGICRNLV